MGLRRDEPPPVLAVCCPRERHVEVAVREDWFYCAGCGRDSDTDPSQGRYHVILDKRDGTTIPHAEFVERWGTGVYRGRRI